MSGTPWALVQSFPDAANRSYLAALILDDAGDKATSAHLYGVAAECAVKATLENASIIIDRRSGLRVHFPDLTTALALNGATRHMTNLLTLLQGPPAMLDNYDIASRYAEDGNIDDALCQQWAAHSKSILSALSFSV